MNYNYILLNRLFNGKEGESPRITDMCFARQYLLNTPTPLYREVGEDGLMKYKQGSTQWTLLEKSERLSPFTDELAVVKAYGEILVNVIEQHKLMSISATNSKEISEGDEVILNDENVIYLTSNSNKERVKFPEGSTIIDLEEYLNLDNIEDTFFGDKIYAISPGNVIGTVQINRVHDVNEQLFPVISVERDKFGHIDVRMEVQFSILIENPSLATCLVIS